MFQKGRIEAQDWADIGFDTTMDFGLSMLYVGGTNNLMKSVTDIGGALISSGISGLVGMGIDIIETWLFNAFNSQKDYLKSLNA